MSGFIFAKMSEDAQKLVLKQFGNDVVSPNAEGILEFNRVVMYGDLSQEVMNQLNIDKIKNKEKQDAEDKENAQKSKDEKKLAKQTLEYKTKHFINFGTLPTEESLEAFTKMRRGKGADLTEEDFLSYGMEIIERDYTIASKEHRTTTRDQFSHEVADGPGVKKDRNANIYFEGARQTFLKNMGENYSEALAASGFSKKQISDMAEEGICPNGFNVHHKIDIRSGGTNDQDNFVLMSDSLYHDMIHAHQNHLTKSLKNEGDSKRVRVAIPAEGVIFYENPTNTITSDQTNEAVANGLSLGEKKNITKRVYDIDEAVAGLSDEQLEELRPALDDQLGKTRGNEGKLLHIEKLYNSCTRRHLRSQESDKDVKRFQLSNGDEMAYRKIEGKEPGIVYIHGSQGSMDGTKGDYLQNYCKENGLSFIRVDLPGHKRSTPPEFRDGTIGGWTDAVLELMDKETKGDQLITGASMGGWIALNAAQKRPDKVKGVLGLAAAPDFTELLEQDFSPRQKHELIREGLTRVHDGFRKEGMAISRKLIVDGKKQLLLNGEREPIKAPVLLLAGDKDNVVPLERSKEIQAKLKTEHPVELQIIEGGGHGMGRDFELEAIGKGLDKIIETYKQLNRSHEQSVEHQPTSLETAKPEKTDHSVNKQIMDKLRNKGR